MVSAGSDEGRRSSVSTRSGFVLVSTYSWTIITVGVLVGRFAQGHNHKIELGLDDVAIVAATVVYLGATVSWQFAIDGGLGKDLDHLSGKDLTLFFKAIYVAGILSIIAMALAKLSSALLIERIFPQSRRAKVALFGSIALFAICSTFAVAFQCGIPRWTMHALQCGNGGLSTTATAVNIATDLLLAFWIVPTFWKMSLDKEKSIAVAMLFSVRAIVAIVAGGQIWATLRMVSSSNPTLDTAEFVVFTQSVSSLSLISASVPRIKRLLGVGGSGIVYPEIQETELSDAHGSLSLQETGSTGPKLVPPNTGYSTVTVSAEGAREEKKKPCRCRLTDWQTRTMGVSTDDDASTSSLVDADKQDGVMMQCDVIVSVEDKDSRQFSDANIDDVLKVPFELGSLTGAYCCEHGTRYIERNEWAIQKKQSRD